MASAVPEMESASIVLIGSFNPAILHPQWFAKQGLIPDSEAATATVDVVSPALTAVRFAWFTLEVMDSRFVARTADPAQYHALQECVSGIFTFLEFTPVAAMGLNSDRHVRAPTEDVWRLLEERLAPRGLWADILPGPREGTSALQSLSVVGTRPDSPAVRLDVTIQPSQQFPQGLFVATNEHFRFKEGSNTTDAMTMLRDNWSGALAYSNEITSRLAGLAS